MRLRAEDDIVPVLSPEPDPMQLHTKGRGAVKVPELPFPLTASHSGLWRRDVDAQTRRRPDAAETPPELPSRAAALDLCASAPRSRDAAPAVGPGWIGTRLGCVTSMPPGSRAGRARYSGSCTTSAQPKRRGPVQGSACRLICRTLSSIAAASCSAVSGSSMNSCQSSVPSGSLTAISAGVARKPSATDRVLRSRPWPTWWVSVTTSARQSKTTSASRSCILITLPTGVRSPRAMIASCGSAGNSLPVGKSGP
jgi:hypothetical protein